MFSSHGTVTESEYEIICISGICRSSAGTVLTVSSLLAGNDMLICGEGGCRMIIKSVNTGKRYKIYLQTDTVFEMNGIESALNTETVSVTKMDMKLDIKYSSAISRYSAGETKRGGDFETADYSVGLSLISKCRDEIFSIDSLYKKSSDCLMSLDINETKDREMIIVSNYETDTLYVAVYGIEREDGEIYLGMMGDLWTMKVTPMSDLIFMASDSGKTHFNGFFAISSYENFNYVDTFNALESAEGCKPVKFADKPTGFSIVNTY